MAKDATDAQRKAARGVMNGFVDLKLDLTRGEGQMTLTPYRISDGTRGSGVTVIYGATTEAQIRRELGQACNALVEQ